MAFWERWKAVCTKVLGTLREIEKEVNWTDIMVTIMIIGLLLFMALSPAVKK